LSIHPSQFVDYEIPKPPRFRAAIKILAIALVCGGSIGATCFIIRDDVLGRLQTDYCIFRCDHYTVPPDRVVYAEDPKLVANLRGNPDYRIALRDVDPPVAIFEAHCLEALDARPEISQGPGTQWNGATLFLHKLRTPGGVTRLVRIVFGHCLAESYGNDFFILEAQTLDTDSVHATWIDVNYPAYLKIREIFCHLSPDHLIIYAGQIDPADASHFLIRYQSNGFDGVVDGRLVDSPGGPTLQMQ